MNYIDQTKILKDNLRHIDGNDELVRDILYDLTDDGKFSVGIEFSNVHGFNSDSGKVEKMYELSKYVIWKGPVISDNYFDYKDIKPIIDRVVFALEGDCRDLYAYYTSYSDRIRSKKIKDLTSYNSSMIQRVVLEFIHKSTGEIRDEKLNKILYFLPG